MTNYYLPYQCMDENNKNNSLNESTDGESNGQLENNSPNGWTDEELMVSSQITRQTDGRMES